MSDTRQEREAAARGLLLADCRIRGRDDIAAKHSDGSGRESSQGKGDRSRRLELTRFRGHRNICVQGVHDGEDETTLHTGIPSADAARTALSSVG
jgi:hypothetical protein